MTDSEAIPTDLIIFGDFSCPFSALASHRAAVLEIRDATTVEWRAVQHLPTQPLDGERVEGELGEMYMRELEQIRSLLLDSEEFPLKVPPVQPNTGLATAGFAATDPDKRLPVRQRLFEAFWFDGRDIGDPHVLVDLGVPPPHQPPPTVADWQQQWESFDNRMVPMLQMPDGHLSRGLGALTRLANWTERH